MTASMFSQNLDGVLDNYADAVEGGNSWRGSGTAYKGIPGVGSVDADVRAGLTLTVATAVSSTVFAVTPASPTWRADKWSTANGPAYWAVGASGTVVGQHRKITGYAPATGRFTVAAAFSPAEVANDTLTVLQGFKRLPNGVDIETDESAPEGYDRYFHLSAIAGRPLRWHGSGHMTFETRLLLRLRLLKYGRLHDWTAMAMTNLAMLRAALVRREHYDGTYVRALTPLDGESAIAVNDKSKIVVQDSYRLVYGISQAFI